MDGLKSLEVDNARSEELTELKEKIEQLKSENKRLQKLIDDIANSQSWRLTAPLRKFFKLLRLVFPLYRTSWESLSCSPGRSIILSDNSKGASNFEIVGPTAELIFQPIANKGYPEGWMWFGCKVDRPMVAMLYFKLGQDYSDSQRVHLSLVDGANSKQLIHLPKGVTGLKLRFFESEGSFNLTEAHCKLVGSIQLGSAVSAAQIKFLAKNPRYALLKSKKAFKLIREGGFGALKAAMMARYVTADYQEWINRYDTITDEIRVAIRKHIDELKCRPLVSVVMPVCDTPPQWLRAAIESVRRQLYSNWELCIADDASSREDTKKALDEYSKKDARIKIIRREQRGHISAASNSALSVATGDWVTFLDHDDELSEHAIYHIVVAAEKNPDARFIYSDEDKITSLGVRCNPHFKSDWNPYLILSQNYICHLSALRRDLVEKLGGFRLGVEGAQDWDLFLRASEEIDSRQIVHIPFVLYHWRIIESSTASTTSAKPYVLERQAKVVGEHLARKGIEASVEILHDISHVRPRLKLPSSEPSISLIIPTKDQLHHLQRCISSILEKTTYQSYEIIIVDNGSREQETKDYLLALVNQDRRVRVISDPKPFNYSRINNDAARLSNGEFLGFLNNDLEVISKDWLSELMSVAIQKDVGMVGARLLYPNGLLQHGGIIIGIGGVAGHNNKGRARGDPGYFNRAILMQNLSAVTAACAVVKRSAFEQVGGFDADKLSVAFNDVDLCLKLRDRGYQIVYNPYAELFHFESASRGYENTPERFRRFENEVSCMKQRWKTVLQRDPYYNLNLTVLTEDFQFAFPPRLLQPWSANIENSGRISSESRENTAQSKSIEVSI